MSRQGELIKNTAILGLGTFLPKFLTILITPILTVKLLKAEYGQYDLITTIESLLLPAVTLQISSAAFRFLIEKKDKFDDTKEIISSIFAFVVPVSLIASVIYYLIAGNKLGVNGTIICLYFLSDILLQTMQQIIRGLGRNYLYSFSSIVRSVGNVFFIALFTGCFRTTNYGLSGVVLAMIIASSVSFLFLLIKANIWKYLSLKSVSCKELKALLSYSWPMVPNNLSGWVLRLSDRLVITSALGIEANAIYAIANRMPTIFSSFQNTFSLAWQENASIASKDDDKDVYYSKMCSWVFDLLIGLMSGLIMCTPIIWKILIRGNYDEAYFQVPILYIGMLFQCMSLTIGGIYIAHLKTKSIGFTTFLAAILNFVIDILFVKTIGIWAGSVSTMVSYLFLLIYRMRDVQRFQTVRFDIKHMVAGITLLSIMAILNYQKNIFCDLSNVILGIIVIVYFDKEIMISVFKTLIRKKL